MNFTDVCDAASQFNEHRDCAVKAITIASGLPYGDVLKKFSALGRAPRSATPLYMTKKAAQQCNLVLTELPKHYFGAKTVRTLGRVLPSKGTYLVRTNRHILTCKNGEVVDHSAGSCRRILQIFKVGKLTS